MEAVIIEVESNTDAKYWLNLAKKAGARAKTKIADEKLANLIEKGLQTKSVSKEKIIKALEIGK